jgi:hypothetical protein
MNNINPEGLSVIILAGRFAGREGICLGRAKDGSPRWAVSPDGSDEIVYLEFEREFGVVVNRGQKPGPN